MTTVFWVNLERSVCSYLAIYCDIRLGTAQQSEILLSTRCDWDKYLGTIYEFVQKEYTLVPDAIQLLQEIKTIVTTISHDSTPWIAFIGALIASIVTGVSGFLLYLKSKKDTRRQYVLDQRREPLFEALQAINHVYANTEWADKPPLNPSEWDITLARTALNKINVYCENPAAVIKAFHRAVGMNGETYTAASINEFIRECARELNLPVIKFTEQDKAWIASLPGTEEAKEFEKRKKVHPKD